MTATATNTVTVWTVTGNNDGEGWTLVYADFEELKRVIWSDVRDAAERAGINPEEGLGTDEFGSELDKDDVSDWCRFIEENGWKCRMYEYEQTTLRLPTPNRDAVRVVDGDTDDLPFVGLVCPKCDTDSGLQSIHLRVIGYRLDSSYDRADIDSISTVYLNSDDEKASDEEEPLGWRCLNCNIELDPPNLSSRVELDWR